MVRFIDPDMMETAARGAEMAAAEAVDAAPGHGIMQFRGIVDALLTLRLRDLRLPAEILAIFNARTRRRSRAMMVSWCLWIAVMDFSLALFDFFILAGPGFWLVFMTRVVIIAGFLTSALLLKQNKLLGREYLAIIIPAMAGILCTGLAGQFVKTPVLELDYLVTAALMAMTAILFLNIDVRAARFLAIFTIAGLGLFTLMMDHTSLGVRLQLFCLLNGPVIALLEARKIMMLYQHRLFLLNMRDEIASAETAHLNAQLSSIAYIDQLTDIPNRRYFDEVCASISETTKNLLPLSICMIDIDHFKLLNDSLGHLQGDHCLRVIASTIRHNLRGKTDILVRYGGEEFLLLLPGTDIDRAVDIAERMRVAIAGLQHANPGSPLGVITASIGITMVNEHPVRIETLIEAADIALYRAKSAGRNRVSI